MDWATQKLECRMATLLTMRKKGFRAPAADRADAWVTCSLLDDHEQVTTLVDVRWSKLSDAGSIPAISTIIKGQATWLCPFFIPYSSRNL